MTQTTPDVLVTELEDSRANLANRRIEIVDGLVDPLEDLVSFREPNRALERHPNREHPLNDTVMEVPGDSVSVVEDTQYADPFMKAGVLDGDAGCDRQCLSECLILLAELVSTHFVGEIEVAIDHGAGSDGDAEEGLHGRMVSGKPVTVGMAAEVLEA